MNLIVVESPTKARTLSRLLGDGYCVEATMGHIKDLPREKLSVDIEDDFRPQYEIIEKKKEVIERLRSRSQKSKMVYLATDPDREGEAIASHVRDVLVNAKSQITTDRLKRIVFHEITKDAVEEALGNPRDIDRNLVEAQIARRVLDRLVGYKLSPLLWRKVRRGLSAGRVQSVAVRLIVEREREIEAFTPEEYWEIWANVKCKISNVKCKPFDVKLIKIDNKKAVVKNKNEADNVVSDLEEAFYRVFEVKQREVKKYPYPPFTTSTMTQAAARILGFSSKKTMFLAQKLYEEGLITYHRTDSTSLSQEAIKRVRTFIERTYGEKYLPETPRIYKTKSRLAQEAHEAIRPTNVGTINNQFPMTNGLLNSHKILYDLIWKRFVACQMRESIFDETTIDVEARSDVKNQMSKVYLLRATGQVMKFDGWRRVIPLSKEESRQLPLVEKDEELDLVKVASEQKFTQPPARYNEASLIKMLEKLGIGRPSTYAPIISTIQARAYVEKIEGNFRPTPVGLAVNDFLVKNFESIVDYSFTAEMENELDGIAKGDLERVAMMRQFYGQFEKRLESVEENSKRVKIETEKLGKKCPKCGKGELVIRVGRFGKFVSCSRFPDCGYKEKYIEKLSIKCPDCGEGDVIIKTTKTGRKFYGCSRYPDCKWASWRRPDEITPREYKSN